ncbi:hypothetical protein KAH37_07535 [bacterium]|nr:hypothetical protein [bacterium]
MKIRNISTIVGILLVLAIIPAFLHFRSLQLNTPKPVVETIDAYPAPKWAKVIYLGYDAFTANFLMSKAQYYYGQHYLTDKTYPLLSQMLHVTIALNPDLSFLLLFGEAALVSMGTADAVLEANKLLQFGHTVDPENYRFLFNQGYNSYYSLGDTATAYKLMYEGARMKSAPKKLYWLVSRVIANSGGYDLGIYYTQERLKTAKDKHMKEELTKRLTLFKSLAALTKAAKKYQEEYAKNPSKDLSSLVKAGYISSISADPYGGEYLYDEEKDIVYATSAKHATFKMPNKKKKVEKPSTKKSPPKK